MADPSRREEVWDAIEDTYMKSIRIKREKEDREAREEQQDRINQEKDGLLNLWAQRKRLVEELSKIDAEIHGTKSRITFDENSFVKAQVIVTKQREKEDAHDRELLRTTRFAGPPQQQLGWPAEIAAAALGNGQIARVSGERKANGAPPSPAIASPAAPIITHSPANGTAAEDPADKERAPETAPVGSPGGGEAERPEQPVEGASGAATGDSEKLEMPEKTGVEVFDSEGNLIGEVKRLDLRNPWIKEAVKLPIKRQVVIRAGRRFGPEDLDKIYEPTDSKGAKWLSCMIQAAGEVQAHQCVTCTKNIGVFSECVIVGGETFPRCANCEWNRQGCHGASLIARPKSPLATRPKSRHSEADGQESPPRTKKERKSLPGGRASQQDTAASEGASPAQKKPRGPRKSLPDGPNQQKDNADDDEADVDEDEDTEEITKDMLVLKDNGAVFTEPDIMRGVPLEKISPSHPYWDPSWPPLEAFITPTLEKWQEKYEKALVESASQSSKYLANRQVNRGNAVLKYLREGPLHPLQIIAKPFITKKVFNYDTIHRLVQILDELLKFKIDVTPAQWVRHRLHQKFLEKGDEFNLDEEIDALYHDPKVRYIRKKSGFGNIGRPSGYRMKGELGGTPKKTPNRGTKRKKEHSPSPESSGLQQEKEPTPAAPTPSPAPGRRPTKKHKAEHPPPETPSAATTSQGAHNNPVVPPPTPSGGGASEAATGPLPPLDGLDFSGYTSRDSYSRDPIWRHDWRVYQVKTAHMTSNPSVTQYYHWVDRGADGTEEYCFEHQVLKDVIPPNKVTWGVYKDPFDFHLRLAELVEVKWSRDSLKMLAVTRRVAGVEWRGEVIVNFKRERTKRRFLAFVGKKGVALVRSEGAEIEAAWSNMNSQVLPGDDSD
ncbi:hypothetical protein CONLIGDRAFT_586657 [Coniochaeta ligniaria NRRL 30616]|uniref:Uncharacterized protein n=1 Tax=Coniochaeta ligniaria NRRL 30616 TaxID=1408157 RepID=A0A1J7J5F3_9PEZI|nr:hypothetical protein CONLIGDRAFT_586657 [Coniochaeta ligniaria NRRL 30616]